MDLPRNWIRTTLWDACSILDSKRIPVNSKERRARVSGKSENELFPYYGATGQVDVIDGYLFEGEHVLLGEDGAPFFDPFKNKAYVVGEKFWVNNHAHILKAHGSNKYLCHFLNSVRYEDHITGTTRPKLTKRALVSIPVLLPPPNEQRRIVEKVEALFDEIDKGVESLLAAKSTLDLYRKSLLKSAFEGRLTADWRAQNPDKLEDPETLLARIRKEREKHHQTVIEEWEKAVSDWREQGEQGKKPIRPRQLEVFQFFQASRDLLWPNIRVRSLIHAPLVNGRSVKGKDGGFPVLRLTALKNGEIDLTESKEGHWTQEDARHFQVSKDDIFVARGNGSKRLVGIAGRVTVEPRPIAFPDTMIRVRVDTDVMRPDFFLLLWNSQVVRRQIELAARTTAGIYKINQQHILSFFVPLPSLTEQAEIVHLLKSYIRVAKVLETEIESALSRAVMLRQSILNDAFSGRLVPQDPNDEPATALLERIQAEKASHDPRRTKRKVSTA